MTGFDPRFLFANVPFFCLRRIGSFSCALASRQWIAALILGVFLTAPATAHEARPAYLDIQQKTADTYQLTWKVPAPGPNQRPPLDLVLPEDVSYDMPPSRHYVAGSFIERSTVRRTGGLEGAEIRIEGLSKIQTDVLVRIHRLDGALQVTRPRPSSPSFVVEASPSTWSVAVSYLQLGIKHILEGIDHLLFLACLLFVAGTAKRIFLAISGFTIAHSITLALSALDLVRIPVPPVEAVIALSIVFLAVEIVRNDKTTLAWRYPVAVSSSFGLLHGFGFAAVLREIGLPQTDVPTALLFFNLGVEVGQLLFLLGVVMAVAVTGRLIPKLRDPVLVQWMTRCAVYLVGSLAVFWMLQRVTSFWK